jgi:hypothetical protein
MHVMEVVTNTGFDKLIKAIDGISITSDELKTI